MKNALMLSGLATALSSLPAMAQELEIIGTQSGTFPVAHPAFTSRLFVL